MKYYSIVFPNTEKRQKTIDDLNKLGYKVIKENNDFLTEDPSGNKIKLII